jgi:hypothetical protein
MENYCYYSTHMVNDKKFVKNFVAVKDSIYVANKDKLEVIGKDTVVKLMVTRKPR